MSSSLAFRPIAPVGGVINTTRIFTASSSGFVCARAPIFNMLVDEGRIFLAACSSQALSAGLAARYTGNFDWPASWMIGFGMLGRAELAFVVIEIAYVQHNIMNTEGFYTLMIRAFLLNCSVPLTNRWWKSHFHFTETPHN